MLISPPSRKNRSKSCSGVSGPFPSLDLLMCEPVLPQRNANPPITTNVSLAFSLARSRLSPSRSMTPPPAGMSCMRTCRSACASTGDDETDDVEAAGEVDDDGSGIWAGDRVTSSGMSGGSAFSVAVVRCWFGVRRHVFTTWMSVSGSGICVSTRTPCAS